MGGVYNEHDSATRKGIAGITELRKKVVAGNEIWIKYHTIEGDGGGGLFRGVTGAVQGTYVDNNGTVIVPTGGDGGAAWVREYAGKLSVKFFGAVSDGITNAQPSIQAAFNLSASTKESVYFPAGDYYITLPISLDSTNLIDTYNISGDGSGDAPSISNNIGTTISTNGCDVFTISNSLYPLNNININGMKIRCKTALETGYVLKIATTSTVHQIKNLYITEVNINGIAGYYNHTSTLASTEATAYITMTRCYSYLTNNIVTLGSLVNSTIFNVQNCLFHVVSTDAFIFNHGGELNISDSWFEGVTGHAIAGKSNDWFIIGLHNTYFEACGGSVSTGSDSSIVVSGKTNLPGSLMTTSPIILNKRVTLSNFSAKSIPIVCLGGIVKTPDSVYLYNDGITNQYAFVPFSSSFSSNESDDLSSDCIAGLSTSIVSSSSTMPSALSAKYAPSNLLVSNGALTNAAAPVTGLFCTSYACKNNGDNGLQVGSNVVINAVTIPLNTAYMSFLNEAYYAVIAVPVVAGDIINSSYILLRNSSWNSFGSKIITSNTALGLLGPIEGRAKEHKTNILAGALSVVSFKGKYNAKYSIACDILIDSGAEGSYKVNSHGVLSNGSKNRFITNEVSSPLITLTASDGAHTDMVHITITNNTSASISIIAKFKY